MCSSKFDFEYYCRVNKVFSLCPPVPVVHSKPLGGSSPWFFWDQCFLHCCRLPTILVSVRGLSPTRKPSAFVRPVLLHRMPVVVTQWPSSGAHFSMWVTSSRSVCRHERSFRGRSGLSADLGSKFWGPSGRRRKTCRVWKVSEALEMNIVNIPWTRQRKLKLEEVKTSSTCKNEVETCKRRKQA